VGDEVHYLLETTPEGKVRAAGVSYVAGSRTPTRSSRGVARSSGSYVVVFAFVALLAGVVMAWEPPLWVPALYLIASLVTFVAYAADKAAARSGGWRVSEGSLLLLGMIGGWPGAIVAQQTLRHKTVKQSFRVLFWMTVLVNIGALLYFTAPGMTHRFLESMM